MRIGIIRFATISILPTLLLTGCKSVKETGPAYSLAQHCVAVQADQSGDFLVADGDGYRFANSGEAGAEKFFLKPSRLGAFLLYDQDRRFLSTMLTQVTRDSDGSPGAEWHINKLKVYAGKHKLDDRFTLVSRAGNLRLLQGKSGPVLRTENNGIPQSAILNLVEEPANECAAFPEAALDAKVSPGFDKPKNPNAPVTGFADMHTHLAFPKAMGGLAMAGNLFSPYGIKQALRDCSYLHGKDGKADILESQGANGGVVGHATAGYPDFPYWPRRTTITHVQAYYRWLQRAYLSGLRLLVTNVTGNPTACELLALSKPGQVDGNCGSATEEKNQIQYIYDLQDYIDAQEGGPGKGWFRVVTSPQQARRVINQNKLAVVLGSEYGTLFDCDEGAVQCTPAYIDRQLQKLYDMGVRSVFPIHRFDNAFGGARPDHGVAGAWMNLASKLSTSHTPHVLQMFDPLGYLFKPIGGHYLDVEQCPPGVQGTQDMMSMEQFVNQDMSSLFSGVKDLPNIGPVINKLLNFAILDKLQPAPDYQGFGPDGHACNRLGLHPLGRYLINRMIDKGMIVEIDHMSYYSSLDTLDILEQRQYSGVVSSHSWMEDSPELRDRIFRLGGLVSPMNHRPRDIAAKIKLYAAEMAKYPYLIGVGIGTDIQGVTSQTDGDPDITITYPFKSVDGKVTFIQPKTGNRTFDFNKEGLAHYGLLPEWLEDFRQVDAQDSEHEMGIFMHSAEAYLEMWERAESERTE